MRKPDMCAPDITAEVESGRRQDIQEEVRFLGHDREDIDRSGLIFIFVTSVELTRCHNFLGVDVRIESHRGGPGAKVAYTLHTKFLPLACRASHLYE